MIITAQINGIALGSEEFIGDDLFVGFQGFGNGPEVRFQIRIIVLRSQAPLCGPGQ